MQITEENFLEELRKKNEKALDYIIENYGWVIQSVVRQKLYNLSSYEDECINDVLLGIWHNSECFNPEKSTFKNWIAGIARYKAIDYQRKYLKDLTYEPIEALGMVQEDTTHQRLVQDEIRGELEVLLSHLKEEDKKIFLAIYESNHKVEEVSRLTGLKREVIYNRLSRTKKKLKKLFYLIER